MKTRKAIKSDAKRIAALMGQLGYSVDHDIVLKKIGDFESSSIDEVFVATIENEVVGFISCHIIGLFHQIGAAGRITSLLVDENHRRKGFGNALVRKAEEYFVSRNCVKFEVTSGDHRIEAHKFYESCGYRFEERRFIKLCG